MRQTLFVTATGTEIGKTFVTALLCRQLRARNLAVDAIKPVISGYGPDTAMTSDTVLILQSLGRPASEAEIGRVSPWRFAAPLTPSMAARRERRPFAYDELVAFCRARQEEEGDVLLIEGVGGIMAPLTERETVLDWIIDLDIPTLVVTGSYLGTLSHTLSALDVLQRRDIDVTGLIVSESEGATVSLAETVETLGRFLPGLSILMLPRLAAGAEAPDLTPMLGLKPS